MNEKRRRKEGTARRKKGTCLPHLRAVRKSRMLTQERLSALSGVSRESIYRLEGGERGAMPDTLWKLALALRTSPEDLIYARPWWWRLSPREPPRSEADLELERAVSYPAYQRWLLRVQTRSPAIIPEIVTSRKYGLLGVCNEPSKHPHLYSIHVSLRLSRLCVSGA
jgi:transcriptional regulator with XRE-family HTH domain